MRQFAAAILLCVFGALLPSATVISLAAPAELLPICCRAHGAHHCMMMAMMNGASGSNAAPLFRASGCPYRNTFHPFTSGPVTAGEQPRSSVTLTAMPFHPALELEVAATLRFTRAIPRAPPIPLLSQA